MSYKNEIERCLKEARHSMDQVYYWRNRYYQYRYYDMIESIKLDNYYIDNRIKKSYKIVKVLSEKGPKWNKKDLMKRIAADLGVSIFFYGWILRSEK